MASGASVVGSVKYDASIDLASLRKSVAEADKIMESTYKKQSQNARSASKEITATSSKDAQARVDAVKREAEQTAKTISSYTPQIQRQFLTVERANNQVTSATVRAQNAIQKYGTDSLQATKATSALSVAVQNHTQQQNKLQTMLDGSSSRTHGFSNAMSKAGAIAGATAAVLLTVLNTALNVIANSISSAVERVDTLNTFPRVLKAMGVSSEDATNSTNKLAKSLQGLPTPLQEGAKGVQGLVAAGLNVGKATDLYLAMNNALIAAGGNASDAQIVFDGMQRAISSGEVPATTLTAMLSRMPTVMSALTKSTGKTRDELQELYSSDPQALIDNLIKLNKEGGGGLASLDSQAREATDGISTSFSNMQTAITRGVTSIIEAIGSKEIAGFATESGRSIEVALKGIADGFKFLREAIAVVVEWLKPLLDYISQNKIALEFLKTFLIVIAGLLAGAVLAAIIIVVSAVSALTFVIELLVKTFIWVAEVAIGAWNGIVYAWNTAVGFFAGIVNGIKSVFSTLIGFFAGLWSTITGMFYNVGVAIGNAVSGAFRGVMNGIIGYVEGIVNGIARTINGIAKGIDDVIPGDQSKFRVPEVRLPRFYNGGFTGNGGKFEPAGIVHAGEFVIPKEQVNQATGMPDWSKVGGQTIEVTVNVPNGVFVANKSDKRQFANEIASLINESVKAKTGTTAIAGI